MKKFIQNIVTIHFIILLLIITNTAHARLKRTRMDIVENMHFYVGAGVGYSFYSLNNEFEYRVEFPNKGSVERNGVEIFGPVVGIKFQDRYGFGAEVGYSFHESLNIIGVQKGKLAIRNTFLDFMNYIPLATDIDDIKVEILVGFGLGHMFMKEYGSVGAVGQNDSYRKYGLRAKVGMQYNIDNHWSVRSLIAYQKVGPRSNLYAIDSVKSVSLDVIYTI